MNSKITYKYRWNLSWLTLVKADYERKFKQTKLEYNEKQTEIQGNKEILLKFKRNYIH